MAKIEGGVEEEVGEGVTKSIPSRDNNLPKRRNDNLKKILFSRKMTLPHQRSTVSALWILEQPLLCSLPWSFILFLFSLPSLRRNGFAFVFGPYSSTKDVKWMSRLVLVFIDNIPAPPLPAQFPKGNRREEALFILIYYMEMIILGSFTRNGLTKLKLSTEIRKKKNEKLQKTEKLMHGVGLK